MTVSVTVYRIFPAPHSGDSYQFALRSPCRRQTDLFRYEITSLELPEGYTLTTRDKQPMILDPLNQPCDLRGDRTGETVTITSDRYEITLPADTIPNPTTVWEMENLRGGRYYGG